ncbi:MAG: hypothetical protein JJ974_03205 [Phycisphaerales bacterium]|nr:hypothetical protein [Phycisphaerales bacterium]
MKREQTLHSSIRVPKIPLIAAIGLVALAGQAAHGQNALGDGRGLEANPRQGSDGRNFQRPSLADQVRFRNAISTGNAPGGLSFRGDLGYQAPGEFTGALGSDALFAFRRDSLYSGLAGMGIRGTDALQYQFSMTTGSRVTQNLVGTGMVSRFDGASSSSLPGGYNTPGTGAAIDPMSQLRATAPTSGTLRSTSSYSSTAGLLPELVSVYESGLERNRFGVVSTPLMGLVSTPMQAERNPKSKTNSSIVSPTSYAQTIKDLQERAKAIRESRQVSDAGGTDISGKTQEELEKENNDWIAQKIRELQEQLLGVQDPVTPKDPIDGTDGIGGAEEVDPSDGQESPVKIIDPMNPGIGNGDPLDEVSNPQIDFDRGQGLSENIESGDPNGLLYQIDPDTLEVIKGSGNRVTYLVDPTAADRDPFAEHMVAGERLLAQGRYFDAEERFTYAMSVRSGNISAQLGRLHAQIGAGLVLSGSMNLQALLTEHLELVSTRYSGDLLPSEERIRKLLGVLRERAGLDERPASVPPEPEEIRVASGILIAYLGFQIGDAEQMESGLAVVREHGTNPDQRLARLLGQIWGAVLEETGPGMDQPGIMRPGERGDSDESSP